MKLNDPDFQTELLRALEDLTQTPKALRASLAIVDTVTGRFVQFAGDEELGLVLDLPLSPRNDVNAIGARRARHLLPCVNKSLFAFPVRSKPVAAREGVLLALQILQDVLRLPPDADVAIEFGTDANPTVAKA